MPCRSKATTPSAPPWPRAMPAITGAGWSRSEAEWPTLSNAAERGPYLSAMNNVRAALDWCFGAGGDAGLGVALAAAAAPVFLAMSLLTECQRWSDRAIRALDAATRGGSDEMHLQAALGMALMFMQGGSDAARVALERALAVAKTHGDVPGQLMVLGPLHMFHLRTGAFGTTLDLAKWGAALAGSVEDPAAAALAHFLLGISQHLAGDLGGARAALEAALRHPPGAPWPADLSRLRGPEPVRRHPGAHPVAAGPSDPGGGACAPRRPRRRTDGPSGHAVRRHDLGDHRVPLDRRPGPGGGACGPVHRPRRLPFPRPLSRRGPGPCRGARGPPRRRRGRCRGLQPAWRRCAARATRC